MKKILLFLATLMVCCLGFAQGNPHPAKVAFSGNYGFITVGNCNHMLKDVTTFPKNRDEELGIIKPLNNSVINNGQSVFSVPVSNSNFRKFRISAPEETKCPGDLTIEKAYLSWGGRSFNSKREEVRVQFRDRTKSLEERTVSAPAVVRDINDKGKGLYLCHAEVTDFLNSALSRSTDSIFTIHVANVQTMYDENGIAGDSIGKFSGWTFTVIYKHPGLPERSLFYYQVDSLGDIKSTESKTTNPLLFGFDITAVNSTISSVEKATMAISTLGAYTTDANEMFVGNPEAFTSENKLKKIDPLLTHDSDGGNAFNNTVQYKYNFEYDVPGQTIESNANTYTRGYDLHAFAFDASAGLSKDTSTFNCAITCESEVHFVSDVILMFGEPNMPEVVLKDHADPNIQPGQEIKYSLTVAVNENTEKFKDIQIAIPFTEYIESIVDIKMTFNGLDLSKKDGTKWEPKPGPKQVFYMNVNGGLSDIPVDGGDNKWKYFSYTKTSPLVKNLNKILQEADTVNYMRYLVDPTSIQQRVLKLKIDSIDNICDVKNDEAIVITFTMKTKEKGDWVYEKNSLKGSKTTYVPQSELTFTTPSDRASVVESIDDKDAFNWMDFICNQRNRGIGDGGGGGGGGGGFGGGGNCGEKSTYSDKTASSKGLYVKDPNHIEVEIIATANCPDVVVPDKLTFSFCEPGVEITTGVLESMLRNKYNYDIAELRRKDSLTWIDVKQDSIYMLARRHGVNRSEVEGLIDFEGVSATTNRKNTTDSIIAKAQCYGAVLPMFIDSLENILKSPDNLSNVYLLFKSRSGGDTYPPTDGSTKKVSLLDDKVYKFTEKGNYFLHFYSPWNAGHCSDTIELEIEDFTPEIPKVFYAGNEITKDTIIYVCRESEIENIKIEKSNRAYDIYRKIESDILSKADSAINVSAEKSYNWNINKEVKTNNPGDYKISLWLEDIGCPSDTFRFTISVTGEAITDHPTMEIKDTIRCQSLDGSMVELSVEDTYDHTIYAPVWYREHRIDSSRVILDSVVDKIKVPLDSVDIFYYSVAYKSGQCISDLRDTAVVEVLPLPDTLASDTMYVCAGYQVAEQDIRNWIESKIVEPTFNPLTDVVRYYKKITDDEEDFVTLADVIAELNTDCGNSTNDAVENMFYVRVMNSCFSAPTRMTIMARCYNKTAPKFAEGVDSVLYCIGDVVASDLNVFVDAGEKSTFSNGYRWQWIPAGHALPEYDNRTDFYSSVSAIYSSSLDAKDQDRELWSVVRIDSNNCVSDADTFQVIVDENITTFPFVGDTTKTIVKNTEPLTIKTCQNTPFFKSSYVPTKPTTEDYTIEWFEKTDAVLGPKDTVFMDKVYTNSDVVGMRKYMVRQSTKLGCKGGWLDVNLVVNPEVVDEPEFDRVELCSGEPEVKVVNKNTPSDPVNLTLNYYYFKDSLKASPLSNVYIKSDSIGEFLNTHSLYSAAYRDITTGCEGKLVSVDAIVSGLPHLPLLDTNMVNMCVNKEGLYNVASAAGATVNTLDNNTVLSWSAVTGTTISEDGIATITLPKKLAKYLVKQKNTVTGCVGVDTFVYVNVDKTFSFNRQKDTIKCFGDTVNLLASIKDSLRTKTDVIDAKVSFKVYKLNGQTPSNTAMTDVALSAITSDAGRHEDQEKRFLVRYEDEVGGCTANDTVTLLFKGLPSIMELDNIDTCFALPFSLPTLDDAYSYQWYRGDTTTKIVERKVALESSEILYLVAIDENECADTASIKVTVHKNPIESLVEKNTVLCQNTGEHNIEIVAQSSDENNASDLNTLIYDAAGNVVPPTINTDTVVVDGKRKILKYEVVQKNILTNCTSKTEFNVEVRKAFKLDAEDTRAVCEPDSVDFGKHVMLYLSANEASVGIIDLATLKVKYGRIDGSSEVAVAKEDASALKYITGRDTVSYTYNISDADDVCAASDTVAVVINFKPSTPKIVDSQDTAFLCSNNVDLRLSAVDTNSDKTNTAIFWGEYRNGVKGDTYEVPASASDVVYTAFAKNIKSGCVSDYDTTRVVVAAPVRVDVIEDADAKRCAGEKINVYEVLANSFHFDASVKRSFIKYTATQNGVEASKSELSSVSRTEQDTILFEMTATDTLTGCTASNSMTVIFHKRPTNSIVAPTIACVGNTFEAKSVGEERKAAYSWQTVDGFELSSIASLKINSLVHDTTLKLITNIEGTGCADTLEHKVTVYATPDRLAAQEPFKFCQTDGDVKIELVRDAADAAAYKLEWTSPNDSIVTDKFVASAKKDTAYKLTVKQINITADTVCKSEPIIVDVAITKHISIDLTDTAICKPLEFNLAQYVQTKKSVSDDGFMPELTSVKFFDGTPVADSTSVETPGRYEITYTDKYGCSVLASVNLAFINKPAKPVLDTDDAFNLCQGNDTVVKPAVVAGDYEFVWNNLGANRTFAAETLDIDASRPVDNVVYTVVRRDTIYGCESDPQTLTYSVKAPFSFDELPAVDICEYETINLDSLAKAHLRPLDDLVLDVHRDGFSGNISSFNVEAVSQEGTYVIDVKNTVSTCAASRSVKVNTHNKPAIKVNGNKPICEGNNLPLTAEGADYFYWNGLTAPSATYNVTSADDNDITVSLLARSVVAENNKTCEMDSSFIVKVHTTPSVLPSQDLFRFCQSDDDVNIELVRDAADAAAYKLEWTSAADSIVSDKFLASARKDTAYVLTVKQLNINADTVCKSEPISVNVEITKKIQITLADTAICMPLEFDLAQYAQTKKQVSDEGFMPQLSSVKLYEGGVEKSVSDSTKINVAGNYKLVYTDRFDCQVESSTNVKFIKKPDTPVLNVDPSFNLCVGTETVVNADIVAGTYKTSWTMVGNGDKFEGDALTLDVAKPTTDGYDVVRIDTVYGCVSEKTHFDYTIIAPFNVANNVVVDICEYETVDLDSVAKAMYPDANLNITIEPTMTLDATMTFDPTNASAEGVYLLNVDHQISNCKAQSEILVNNFKKPEITVTGNEPICKGDTLMLKVSGGDFHYWNGSTISADYAYVVGHEDGESKVGLTVSKMVGASNKVCKTDSVVTVIVNKVPDLLTGKLDTAYCQDGKTGALSLEAVEEGAKVVWYSQEDGYQTARPNGSFAPSATEAGDFTFKFKQTLGNCSTKLQDYVVTIEDKITDVPVVSDTAYCVGETPVELIANWKDYACAVKWTDKNQNDVDILPSTEVAGQTQYCAHLTRGACVGQPVCMTVYVKDRFNTVADIQDTFRFCAGTGVHRLEPNTQIPGVRLNWYSIRDVKRLDYAEFDADGTQTTDTYYVTQSEINGCESDSVKVEIVKVPAVVENTYRIDTCRGSVLSAAELMVENGINYELTALYKVASDGRDSVIPQRGNIGFNGTYKLAVKSEYGCVGVETFNVNLIEPENVIWPNDGIISCPGEQIEIKASSSNSWFKLLDVNDTEFAYFYDPNDSYVFEIDEYKQFAIVAMVKGHESCTARRTLRYDVFAPEKPEVQGKPGVCKGDELRLNVSKIERDFVWDFNGVLVSTTDELKMVPEQSGFLRVSGTDRYGCPVSDTVEIKVVDINEPKILVHPRISSTKYHINRDTTEVDFEARIASVDDGLFTYSWDFGDGSLLGISQLENHVYSDTVTKLSRLVNVSLTVTHEFGCVGKAFATLYIDPAIEVPNTFVIGTDIVFMENYDLEIFDRVGNLIHKGLGWDGTYDKNGDFVFHDTYFYSLTYYVAGEEQHKTGYITVVR